MKIKDIHYTSANMDSDFYNDIFEASKEFNITEQQIFKDLLNLTTQNSNCGNISGILTEYQSHSPEKWETFYYSLNNNEIESFGKHRHKYKVSISKLAFMGFVLFWKLLIFTYLDRLKIPNRKIKFYSYSKYYKKTIIYVEQFKKRQNIILKE